MFYLPDDATEEELIELAAEQRAVVRKDNECALIAVT